MLELAKKVKVNEIRTCTAAIQRNGNNVLSESVSDYVKRIVTMSLLDYLTTKLNERFDSASVTAYSAFGLILMISMVYKMFPGGKNLDHLLNFMSRISFVIKP